MRQLRRYLGWQPTNHQQEVHELSVRQVLESHSARQILHIPQHRRSASPENVAIENDQRQLALLEEGSPQEEYPLLCEYQLNELFLERAVQVHPAYNSHSDSLLALRWTANAFKELRDEIRSSDGQSRIGATSTSSSISADSQVHDRDCSTDADEALQLFHEVVSLANDQLSLRHAAQSSSTSPPGLSKEAAKTLLLALYLVHLPDPLTRPQEEDSSRPERSMLDSVLAGALTAHKIFSAVTWVFARGRRRRGAEHFCNAIIAAVGGVAFTGVVRINRMLVSDPGRRLPMPVGDHSSIMTTLLVQCPLCRERTPANHAIKNVRAGDNVPVCCVCTESASDVCLPCGHLCLCQVCFAQMPRQSVQQSPPPV